MRKNYRTFTALVALAFCGCAATPAPPTAEARSALSPAGTLRAGILLTTALQVTKDPASGELKGVAIDLGNELARRLGVPFTPVGYSSIGGIMEGARSGQWDIAFLAVESGRAKDLDYAAPFMEVELSYLVPAGSSLKTVSDVDQPGVRIAVANGGGPSLLLPRMLKHALLVSAPDVPGLVEMLRDGQADAAAANTPTLFAESTRLPGSRVLDGRVATVQYGIATRKGQAPGNEYVCKFIDDARAEGLIKAAIDKAGLRGVLVAAPQ